MKERSSEEKRRYIDLLKFFSQKLDSIMLEAESVTNVSLSEVDKYMYELDPLVSYIERDEYNHLRYLINNRLRHYEKEIIYMTFGFYGRCYTKYEIANKLKMTPTYVSHCRNKIILKLKKWLVEEDIVNKKSPK